MDGQIAVGLWPTKGGQILGPEGFTVHLANDDDLEVEHVYPAGTWFLPPPGRFKVWTEGASRTTKGDSGTFISSTFSVLTYAARPFRGRGFAGREEVTVAGRVELDPGYKLKEGQSLRLLHLDATSPTGLRTRGFLRAVLPAQAVGPVLMPTGKIVAFVYDTEKQKYLATSKPVTVSAHGIARIRPVSQHGVSDLLAILHRTSPVDSAADDAVEVSLQSPDGARRPPDVLIPTWEWIYALWYDVPGRSVEVEVGTPQGYLASTEVVLEPGGVATLRGELQPRPHLDVRLELPPELKPRRAVLEIERRDDRQRVVHKDLSLEPQAVTRIEGLPAADLAARLELETDPIWKLWQRVDISDGRSRELVFRPRPMVLTGTIYYGDQPAFGKLTVQTLNEEGMDLDKATLDAEVNEDGEYRVVLFSPGKYLMSVELPGAAGPPFRERYAPYLDEDTVFDIHIPRSGARVKVRDAITGKPVEGAEAVVYNGFVMDFRDPPIRGGGTSRGISGEDGVVELPPLFPGTLGVRVRKDGYLDANDLESRIETEQVTELTVDLEPVGETVALEIRLPDGRPAASAELRAQTIGWNEPPSWQAVADVSGVVRVPERVKGLWLLVRHPDAGSWVERWNPTDDAPVTWTLSRAAGPVTFRTVGLDGAEVPYAGFAVRFPATWIAGLSLAWLTECAVAGAGADGLWLAGHLPAERLLVVAGTAESVSLARQDSLYGMALPISPPWPADPIEVPADRRP